MLVRPNVGGGITLFPYVIICNSLLPTASRIKLLPIKYWNDSFSHTKCNIPKVTTIVIEALNFFHRYLQRRYQEKELKEEDDSDVESVQSEEFEEMIDKMSGVKEDDDEEIDFMNEIGDSLKSIDNKKSEFYPW